MGFFEKSYLPHSVCEGRHINFQHLSVNLLISSFLLWQKRWDEANRQAPVERWMRARRKRDGEYRSQKASHLPYTEPDCEADQLKLPPGGEKVKKEIKSLEYTPSQPLLFCLLCVTNLQCPAGTNYSILMSAVSNNCIWKACYPSSTC